MKGGKSGTGTGTKVTLELDHCTGLPKSSSASIAINS